MGTKIELANCEAVMLREIQDTAFTQKMIAKTYALSMASGECDSIDWARVNGAIVQRWSVSGLERVKELAWSGGAFR
jgi:hypothetical protein